jgi:hypothetical protein
MGDDNTGRILAAIEQLRTDLIGDMTRLRTDLMARMDRLQARVDEMRDETLVAFGTSDRIERKASGAEDQVRLLAEQFSTMFRLVHRIEGRLQALEDRQQ